MPHVECNLESFQNARRCIGHVRRGAIRCSQCLMYRQLENLACNPADITAHWMLNSVTIMSGVREHRTCYCPTVCYVKTPVSFWRSYSQRPVSVFPMKNTSVTSPNFASSVMENIHFISPKALNRVHLFNPWSKVITTKCTTLCTCVSIFSQTFSRIKLAH